jgi:hypothetical protein
MNKLAHFAIFCAQAGVTEPAVLATLLLAFDSSVAAAVRGELVSGLLLPLLSRASARSLNRVQIRASVAH